jgi:uncharacterized radical SAM superfamily Fe-S cluster-containing enzyme
MLHNDEPDCRNPLPGKFNGTSRRPLMAMVEITGRCNMACPVCFANSGSSGTDVDVAEVQARVKRLLEIAGPIPIQISGGEPTLHPELPDIIRFIRGQGFNNIELITNGIRISNDPGYLGKLAEHGLSAIYLQFDSLNSHSLRTIRGQDMRETRQAAVAAARKHRLCCTMAVAVTPGVNDSELHDIFCFGRDNIDTVRAINFQAAVPFTGRYAIASRTNGYDLPSLVSMIEEQCGLPPGGFLSDITGHPGCNAMSLVYLIDGKPKPLFNHLSRDRLNSFLGENTRETLLDLFMGRERFIRKHITDPRAWKLLLETTTIFGSRPILRSLLKPKHLLLFAKSFMPQENLDAKRIEHCCYGISAAEGVFSFCAYNNLYRNRSKT